MSWIFAVIGEHLEPHSISRYQRVHSSPLSLHKTGSQYIAVGGLEGTCLHGAAFTDRAKKDNGWAVVGLGIKKGDPGCRFMSAADWETILSSPTPPLRDIDGHFVAVRWSPDKVECFTDQLGMRTAYLTRLPEGVALSTRLDWLSRLNPTSRIDFEELGSRWEFFNQFSYTSLVTGIQRLGPGGTAVCTSNSLSANHTHWSPTSSQRSDRDFVATLQSFVNPELAEPWQVSLGLSGGLDSRVLLSLLASTKRHFALHLFGHPDLPDVKISRRIAAGENLPQRYFDEPLPSADGCVSMASDYLAQSCLVVPASGSIRSRFYALLYRSHSVDIDGGLGEIARRQFMNRLRVRGRDALRNADPGLLLPFLRSPKGPIFTEEVRSIMRRGTERQLLQVRADMPPIQSIGWDNYIDLLVVRYRFPNYSGPEQATMDGLLVSYMPFAQPTLVDSAFALPSRVKRNGRLFRQIIRQHSPSLTTYPLVKGTSIYPFSLPTIPSWLLTTLKARLGILFVDPTPVSFLGLISEFVRDTVRSTEVRTFEAYDYRHLLSLVDRFYKGELSLAGQVDWWLAFELWRRGLKPH